MRVRIALGLVALLLARELPAQHQFYKDCAPDLGSMTVRRGRVPWNDLARGRVVVRVVSAVDTARTIEARVTLDSLTPGHASVVNAFTDRTGWLTLDSLLPGRYLLSVRAIGFVPLTELYELRPSVGDTLLLALKRDWTC